MTIKFVSNGDPNRIPPIGTQIKLTEYTFFIVESYGKSTEHPTEKCANGDPVYIIELKGCVVITAGSPMEVLENILGGGKL